MGFFKDFRNIVAFENSPHKVDIQEWDCFDDLVQEWKSYFEKKARAAKIKPSDLQFGGSVFDSAMNLDGSTPPAKRSGGNCTARAVHLFNKYGRGSGPTYGAAMAEGLHLAKGGRSNYR
ncbi:hypothetical protein SEA_SAMISTI12_219 [Streptomyces phage Samisti12]|uniref:Uncharacterized protein n=3 Tax=Samistivirus TaxID=2560220 RepID=A0A223G081_9CAUD|nr:hypothetical protein FDI39_gp089 [Streptomyces phage Samisti12]AST15405.1 hypothetical protein SEA_SAMISTI12_219 [Streptomyces phage Samisti12]QGH78361.1 hypothetical protein SEA_TRIBUTE_211 [Streptomyces phage Tribute]QRI46162.1 hypothetical protein SEA_CROSS_214 [Streptomyces phage Cross]WNN95533.1 hypothetical protein SEA_WATERMOORE_214 [Streptomyces phage Watermoore]